MKKIKIFIDGSVDNKFKIGFASYLVLDEKSFFESLENKIKLKKFENTSSTKLELEAFLWALNDIKQNETLFEVYTDCQNIVTLLERREKLESNNYLTRSNKIVRNHLLYKEFYRLIDSFHIELIKIKGHSKKSLKNDMDLIFSLVDKTSRKALRNYLKDKE